MGTLDLYFQFLPRNRFFNVFETHLPTLTTGSGFLPMEIRYLEIDLEIDLEIYSKIYLNTIQENYHDFLMPLQCDLFSIYVII